MAADIPLDQPFDPGLLPELRAAVQAHARGAGMPEEQAMDVVLSVHELMANAISHGAGKGRLRIWQAAGALHCQVDDDGGPAPPGRPGTHPAAPADPWPVRPGHGLWVVRQVADHLEVTSGPAGTRATVAFALPPLPNLQPP
jgi:anti-sigma regulatory factor (Ser/Thr protein kinase)